MKDFLASLSTRQREIYDLRILGYTNQGMADHLNIAKRAVEVHIQVITLKAKRHGLEWRFALYESTPTQQKTKCCEGGSQWGHSWDCHTLP